MHNSFWPVGKPAPASKPNFRGVIRMQGRKAALSVLGPRSLFPVRFSRTDDVKRRGLIDEIASALLFFS